MICEDCNGTGAIKRRFGTIKKRYCLACFGTGSVCRQQLRQRDRRAGREARVMAARTAVTKGANRETRRNAVRGTKRNDGRQKVRGVTLLALPRVRS